MEREPRIIETSCEDRLTLNEVIDEIHLREICDGYCAGDDGHIYSISVPIGHPSCPRGRLKGKQVAERPWHRDGYLMVNLFMDGKEVTRTVHSLVALAWHGPCPEGYEVDHIIKGNVKDNRPSNLTYVPKPDHKEIDALKD